MKTKNLLITLGHNSSAIFVHGDKVIGYEQERLSGIKADSQFPMDAINEIISNVGFKEFLGCDVFISHWFDHGKEATYEFKPSKYMARKDYEFLQAVCGDIKFVDANFTHHDAHAYSAMSFFNYFYKGKPAMAAKQVYTIVADGFGTNQEVVSIYESHYDKDTTPKLIHRVYGYECSLGLMYQYATSFCNMKENQDEYKFLGYEAHILDCFDAPVVETLNSYIKSLSDMLLNMAEENTKPICGKTGEIDTHELSNVKQFWHRQFADITSSLNIEGDAEHDYTFKLRVAVAYLIQGIIEKYFVSLVSAYNMSNVICVGGCFYNVKLNNAILENTDGLFSVMPLAGDQGAAIGMYSKFTGEQFPFGTLAIGKRRLRGITKNLPRNAFYRPVTDVCSLVAVADEIANEIANGNIVNLIYGNMEFGPRALCNTSTLMLPTAENVAATNHMNSRNEVMPCAPVCSPRFVTSLFDKKELDRVIGSDMFMICTHTYIKDYSLQYAGVMHRKPICFDQEYTGRPQIVRPDSFMDGVLRRINEICDAKCIVNTSFNVHGRPIAFDTTEILQNFEYQYEHAKEGKKPLLYIVEIPESCPNNE